MEWQNMRNIRVALAFCVCGTTIAYNVVRMSLCRLSHLDPM